MKIKLHGVDNVIKKLNQLENRVKEVEGNNQVPVFELLSPDFMKRNTGFATLEEMLLAGDFIVESKEDFEAIPDKLWDEYVSKVTQFSSWQTMLENAGNEWVKNKIGI